VRPRLKRLVSMAAATAVMLAACLRLPPTQDPIPTVGAEAAGPGNDTLVVMLPGMGDRAGSFADNGFLEIGANHGLDVIAVDAHFGYYRERSLLPRLRHDVILPAREHGYEHIWLLGVSMGGFGSLLYAREHAADIDGIILLAPFLGDDDLIANIRSAGRLTDWTPPEEGFRDYEVAVWEWLQREATRPDRTPILVGYGESDRLAGAVSPLVETLDAGQVYRRPGNHKWSTWAPLWRDIAARIGAVPQPDVDPTPDPDRSESGASSREP